MDTQKPAVSAHESVEIHPWRMICLDAADVIAIEGDSYRRREAESDKKARRVKKAA